MRERVYRPGRGNSVGFGVSQAARLLLKIYLKDGSLWLKMRGVRPLNQDFSTAYGYVKGEGRCMGVSTGGQLLVHATITV